VVTTQRDELLADGAPAVGLSLALLGVRDDPLHLVARGRAAVGVATLAGVNQTLDAARDRVLPVVVRVRLAVRVACRNKIKLVLVNLKLVKVKLRKF